MATIFMHEVHEISGGKMAEFEANFRDVWRPTIERHGDARLVWFWHLTHGTGASYQAVSITAFEGLGGFERYLSRVTEDGDLRAWTREIGSCRHEVTSKLLVPTPWSPFQAVDFQSARSGSSSSGSSSSQPAMYLQDTCWPYPGKLDGYVAALGSVFLPQVQQSGMISVAACWTTCPGTGKFHELVLLQKILDWSRFSHLLTDGEGNVRRGDWMEEGLKHRDRWESRLLRTASWSPS